MNEELRLREVVSQIIRKVLPAVIEDFGPAGNMNAGQFTEDDEDKTTDEDCGEEHKEEIEEISTSDGAGAYLMPMAFTGGKTGGIKKQRSSAEKVGYKLTPAGEKAMHHADKLQEAVSRYHQFKKDPKTPRYKIGKSVVEIGRHLDEINKIISMNVRLKKESNTPTSQYWKRTMGQMAKLEQKMIHIAEKLREMKI
jgi:hypothetical protein